ncbi:MAG: hypothetical protein ABIR59_02235 [Gemmatimonadales bacterium]
MIVELRELVSYLEAKQRDCRRQILRVSEASTIHQTVQQRVLELLPPDSPGFRTFDRLRRQRTAWWSGDSLYVSARDCANLAALANEIATVVRELDPDGPHAREDLRRDLEDQKALMVAVSTGGPRIDDVNREYTERRSRLILPLKARGLEDPSPYDDLWEWHGKWSADLPSYRSRREYIRELFAGTIRRLSLDETAAATGPLPPPSGWPKVDRNLGVVRKLLDAATAEIDFQQVGLICRESLIDLAQAVYHEPRHPAPDGVAASATDAKRMLDAYFSSELAGSQQESVRRHAKAALVLANDLTHARAAGFRQAALCIEATGSVVNIVAIVSGRRDPSGPEGL